MLWFDKKLPGTLQKDAGKGARVGLELAAKDELCNSFVSICLFSSVDYDC